MGVFVRERAANPAAERRMLTFISPPVGAYTQALQDWSAADPEGAMRLSTVWACANKIALSLAMMTPAAYKGPAVGQGQATPIVPAPPMLVQPGSDTSMFEFTYAAWISLKLRGNVYGLILDRDKYGYPSQIELQHPDQVRVRKDNEGQYEYRLRNELVDPAKIWHKAIHRMPGSRVGMSTIQYAARTTRTVQAAEGFGLQYFQDGGHPSGILTNKNANKVSQDQATSVKQKFLTAVHGSREPVVMAGGWEYQQIQIKPDESQFLNTIGAGKATVCEFFGMKPSMIGLNPPSGSSITYQNVEQNSLDFLLYPVSPWMVLWEQWLAELTPGGQYVKCDTSGLVRTDILTRWQAYHLMIGSRALTQNEVRAMDDRPPLTPEQQDEVNALVMPIPSPIATPKQGE